jgi:hypothetical protein
VLKTVFCSNVLLYLGSEVLSKLEKHYLDLIIFSIIAEVHPDREHHKTLSGSCTVTVQSGSLFAFQEN